MNEKYTEFNEEVNLGEQICLKIKHIYFANTAWNACYRKVGDKLIEIKAKARKCLAGMTEIEMLQILRNFSTNDIKDLMDEAKDTAIQRK
jgi:hypothetical protein